VDTSGHDIETSFAALRTGVREALRVSAA